VVWLAALGLLGALAAWTRVGPKGRGAPAPGGGQGSAPARLRGPGFATAGGAVYLWTALTWVTKFLAFATLLRHFLPVDLWRALVGVMGAELSSVLPFHGIAGAAATSWPRWRPWSPPGWTQRRPWLAVNLHLFVLGVTLLLGALAFLLPRGDPTPGLVPRIRPALRT